MKVIMSLQNRGIFFREATKRVTSWEGDFLNFLRY